MDCAGLLRRPFDSFLTNIIRGLHFESRGGLIVKVFLVYRWWNNRLDYGRTELLDRVYLDRDKADRRVRFLNKRGGGGVYSEKGCVREHKVTE